MPAGTNDGDVCVCVVGKVCTEFQMPAGTNDGDVCLCVVGKVCTEFIMPAGTNNMTDMFPALPYTLEQRDEYCETVWQVKPRNNWARISLWGKGLSFLFMHTQHSLPHTHTHPRPHSPSCTHLPSYSSSLIPSSTPFLTLTLSNLLTATENVVPVVHETGHLTSYDLATAGHLDSSRADKRQHYFTSPTGYDLALSWLFRPLEERLVSVITYLLTYLF